MSDVDPYFCSRDHDAGPGAWCVRGPNGFKMTVDGLKKEQAFIIGKILSSKSKRFRFRMPTGAISGSVG
jgi:hypothetical protein